MKIYPVLQTKEFNALPSILSTARLALLAVVFPYWGVDISREANSVFLNFNPIKI